MRCCCYCFQLLFILANSRLYFFVVVAAVSHKELQQVQHVLEAREKKVMSTSEEMVRLMESNQALQGELDAAREMSSGSMEEMREEFTKRIGTSQKKLQVVTKVWSCAHCFSLRLKCMSLRRCLDV